MEEQFVRDTIDALIARKERRIDQVHAEIRAGIADPKQALRRETLVAKLEHGVLTLIELQHNLRLCGCPDEAYAAKE